MSLLWVRAAAAPYEIRHATHPDGTTLVTAHGDGGDEVGWMELDRPHPERGTRGIRDIEVNAEHQRKGVATQMWGYAKDQGLSPQHDSWRTHDGDAWAKSVGDYFPPAEIS